MNLRDGTGPARGASRFAEQVKPLMWVTNAPAPYRFATFEELARTRAFTLKLTGASTSEHRWARPVTDGYETVDMQRWWRLGFLDSDIILGKWEDPRIFVVAIVRRVLGLPTVAFYESILASHRFRHGPVDWARRIFFHSVDAILTVGPASTAAVMAMNIREAQIVTGHNAVDVLFFNDTANELRVAAPVQSGHHCLFVGRLVPLKNIETSIRAWQQIRQESDTFTIVGSGPLRKHLELVVAGLHLSEVVEFVGYLEGRELAEQYALAQTLVLASTREVWGLVVNEALAAGLHAVVSDLAGVARSVNGMRGVFVTPPDQEDIGIAMVASRQAWRGPISSPEILSYTPERLAAAAIAAVSIAQGVAAERRLHWFWTTFRSGPV